MAEKSQWERWQDACQKADAVLHELKDIQEEFESTYEDMSEKQQETEKGQRLETITDLPIDDAIGVVEDCINAEKP